MFRTSSKLQRAQGVHRECRICIHANEPATAWTDTPRLIKLYNTTVLQWTLRITDTLVHRLLSFIRGMSFIGVFYFSHLPRHLILIL